MQTAESPPSAAGAGLSIGLAVARFNRDITAGMFAAARKALLASGVAESDMITAEVPGALELPFALTLLAPQVDAAAAIGCVIRGETYHFQIVADGCARGILQAQIQTGVPMTNGVLTVECKPQALRRIGKGAEAALAAVEMAALRRRFAGANSAAA